MHSNDARAVGRQATARSVATICCAIAIGLIVGCFGAEKSPAPAYQPKAVVAFVDFSQSTKEDVPVYLRALERIRGSLQSGDRIIIGAITPNSVQDFLSYPDLELPPALALRKLNENSLDYADKEARHARHDSLALAQFDSATAVLLSAPHKGETAVLSAIKMAGQMLESEPRRKVLVLMSDMLETAVVDLETPGLTDARSARYLERLEKDRMLANLAGYNVYVVGIKSAGNKDMAAAEQFWRQYFDKTGATVKCMAKDLYNFSE